MRPRMISAPPPPELLSLPLSARGLCRPSGKRRAPPATTGAESSAPCAAPHRGVWQELYLAERSRFLRHVRPYWDVHRHRAAPTTWNAIQRMREAGELQIRAARVVRYEPTSDGVRVVIRPRGASSTEALFVERVVNCTGPSSDVRRLGDRFLDALCRRGLAVPDALSLGLDVSDDLALLDADGQASAFDLPGRTALEGAILGGDGGAGAPAARGARSLGRLLP